MTLSNFVLWTSSPAHSTRLAQTLRSDFEDVEIRTAKSLVDLRAMLCENPPDCLLADWQPDSLVVPCPLLITTNVDLSQLRGAIEAAHFRFFSVARGRGLTSLQPAFLSGACHDLRTPVAAIIGLIGLLEDTPLEQRQHSLVSAVRYCCDSLLVVVDGLIDLSLLESSQLKLHCESFNVRSLIDAAVNSVGVLARDKKLVVKHMVEAEVPETLLGDPWRLRQIVFHLLGNAAKFTAAGSISVAVIRVGSSDTSVDLRFEIRDSGAGLSPADQERILEAAQHSAGGLGLRIVSALVRHMHGRFGLESQLGQGSLFWFELPFEVSVPPHCASCSESAPSTPHYRLLVAEDNPIVARVLKLQLEELGHQVTNVADGLQAFELASHERFDAVIMDCQMPHMDGFEATRRLRELYTPQELPIIALTANARIVENYSTFSKAGMNDYLIKPALSQDLQRLLLRWVDSSAAA